MALTSTLQENFKTVRLRRETYDFVRQQGYCGSTFDETLRAVLGLNHEVKIRKASLPKKRQQEEIEKE